MKHAALIKYYDFGKKKTLRHKQRKSHISESYPGSQTFPLERVKYEETDGLFYWKEGIILYIKQGVIRNAENEK